MGGVCVGALRSAARGGLWSFERSAGVDGLLGRGVDGAAGVTGCDTDFIQSVRICLKPTQALQKPTSVYAGYAAGISCIPSSKAFFERKLICCERYFCS